MIKRWPRTLSQAVTVLRQLLAPGELAELKALSPEQLPLTHFGVGAVVRNEFGLWEGNDALLEDCAAVMGRTGYPIHADDASALIVEHLWRELREDAPAGPH